MPSNIPLCRAAYALSLQLRLTLLDICVCVCITSTSSDNTLQEDLGRGGQELPLYPGGRKELRVGDLSIRSDLKVVKLSLYIQLSFFSEHDEVNM